jgi:peptidase E
MNTTSANNRVRDDQPDIVVVSPDGEYLIIVLMKLTSHGLDRILIDSLKHYMVVLGCSNGLLICGATVTLLRDSLEQSDGSSIQVIGEAKLPETLLPSTKNQSPTQTGWEFETRVQQWLEGLTLAANVQKLPEDLQHLFSESILNLLRMGEIRSGGPRWSQITA